MPDLTAAVAAWRAAARGSFRDREDVLDELESHLWDAAERLCAGGLPPAEAVRAAAARLGAPATLAAEFAKVPAPAIPWWPARLAWAAAALVAAGVALPFAPRFAAGGVAADLAAHVTGVTVGYAVTILVGALSAWLLVARLFREPPAGRLTTWRVTAVRLSVAAAVLTTVGIAFGTRCPFEKHGWCLGLDTREVGGVGIALWNVAVAAVLARAAHPPRSALLVGAAGTAVVVLGWLAAARAAGQSYGPVNSLPVVVSLLAAAAGVGLTALAPAGCLRPRS